MSLCRLIIERDYEELKQELGALLEGHNLAPGIVVGHNGTTPGFAGRAATELSIRILQGCSAMSDMFRSVQIPFDSSR